jgi:hypothetical protein
VRFMLRILRAHGPELAKSRITAYKKGRGEF